MAHNVQSMAYYGEVPWHGLGKQVHKGISAKELIQAAGLDWVVELKPARGSRKINEQGEFSRYEIVRLPRPARGEEEVLFGVVSRRYQALQNSDAFGFFDPIVGENKAYYETAGALGEGERVWVMARLPDAMKIAPGDECQKYLLLSNTHNGEGAVTVKFTAVRVVCQNTLMLSMTDNQKTYRVRHSQKMQMRLEELSDFLAATQSVYLEAEKLFQRMAKIKLEQEAFRGYLEAVFPRTPKQQAEGGMPERWGLIRELYESWPDLQIEGARGTLWGAYNAVTLHVDHQKLSQAETSEKRLDRIWFGSGAEFKLKALEKAREMSTR